MSYAVNDVLEAASKILNDVAMVRWPQAELLKWLNDGARELIKFRPDASVKTVSLALVAGAKQSVPADCYGIVEMRQAVGGPAVTACDRAALDAFRPDWMTVPVGHVVKHFMADPNPALFYVYPAQDGTPATVVLTYTAYPATVTAGQNIAVRDIYASNLVDYLLYRAFSKDAEAGSGERAMAHYGAFKG